MATYLQSFASVTALGNATETAFGLQSGNIALKPEPVSGEENADRVPLALRQAIIHSTPPRWWQDLQQLLDTIPAANWGSSRRPVIISSSNFGIDHLYHIGRGAEPDADNSSWATAHGVVRHLKNHYGWNDNVHLVSHACVSAHVAISMADQWVQQGIVDEVLVISFDYIGYFVSCGFHSLKILNDGMPQPYRDAEVGSIGLGDGAAWCVFSGKKADWQIAGKSMWNEMHHFTANDPSGAGFDAVLAPLQLLSEPGDVWVKGHGTGTLDAGRLESTAVHRHFPGSPLVSWKGSLGHTLGSCALVELVLAIECHQTGTIPGTVATNGPTFAENVAVENFTVGPNCRSILLLCNAFGGAHGGLWIRHD